MTAVAEKPSLASLERQIDKLVDDLVYDIYQYGQSLESGGEKGAQKGQQTRTGSPQSAGESRPSSGEFRPSIGSETGERTPTEPDFPYSKKRPRWRGLRGLWRWLYKGYSPDNPDYQHLYSPEDRTKTEKEWPSWAKTGAKTGAKTDPSWTKTDPSWAKTDPSKWIDWKQGLNREHMSLEDYRLGSELTDILADEVIQFYSPLNESLSERIPDYDKYKSHFWTTRIERFRRNLKRIVMNFAKNFGEEGDISFPASRSPSEGGPVGTGDVSTGFPKSNSTQDDEDEFGGTKHTPPRNPNVEKTPHSLDVTDDEYEAGMKATPQADVDKAADVAQQATVEKEAGNKESPKISTAKANKEFIKNQLDAIRSGGWTSDIPLDPESDDYLNKWFTPARMTVKTQGLVPALRWLVTQGVNIMEPVEVAEKLREKGMKGKDGRLVVKLFKILDVPLDDRNAQAEVLTAIGWKKGFKMTATGTKQPAVGTGDVHRGVENDLGGKKNPAKDEEPPEQKIDDPFTASKEEEPEEISPDVMSALGQSDKPSYASYGGEKETEEEEEEPSGRDIVSVIAPESGVSGWGDAEEIEPFVAKYLRRISDDNTRDAAVSAWKAIKKRIESGEIHPEDVADQIDMFKDLASGMIPSESVMSARILRRFLGNERLMTRLEARQQPVEKLKDFYLDKLRQKVCRPLVEDEGKEINPATGKPIMTYDDFLNLQTSFGRFGGKQMDMGRYVFDTAEQRDKALEDALPYYPELGYELVDEDGKYEIILTGE